MLKAIETLQDLVAALSEPKSTITSVSRWIASTPTIGRWLRESRAGILPPFEYEGETLPLHEHVRKAQQVARARYAAGERPPRPLRHRVLQPVEIEDDPTADMPHAPDHPADNLSVDRRVAAPAAAPVERVVSTETTQPVESALQKDLRERLEARARGEVMPPLNPVQVAAPSRYVSPEDRSEGIGKGTVREGGFKIS